MEIKKKILQIFLNDEKLHMEHCKELLNEKNLTLEDVEFLTSDLGDSESYIEKINWYLKGV